MQRVVFAMLVAGLLVWDDAQAQQGCVAGNPLMMCPVEECIALQANVHGPNACGDPVSGNSPVACRNIAGCFNLRQTRQRWLNCYTARNIINARCWNGGDLGHQQQAAQAIQNVAACDLKIKLPEPEGCADFCS